MKKLMVAVAAMAACVGNGLAVDAVWVNTTTSAAQNYLNPANWTDTEGNPLTVAPTNAGDTAVINIPESTRQTITIQGGTGAVSAFRSKTVNLGTVSGNMFHTIGSATDTQNGTWWMTLGLDDVSDFEGLWSPSRTKLNYSFSGQVKDVKMSEMTVSLRPAVYVPAETTVALSSTSGGGAIEKSGSGKLVIGATGCGDRTILYHTAGTLELKGRLDGETSFSMPVDPVFWVDASKTNLMDITHDEATGRDYISKWYDCRYGDGVHTKAATPINNAALSKPWISSWVQNGLPVVDFGAINGTAESTLGPGASLRYSLDANAKELFIVWMDTKVDGANDSFFIGQIDSYQFHRGYGNAPGGLLAGEAHANVRNGFIYLDGTSVSKDTIPAYGRFHVVNYSMLGNGLLPNTFCNDRTTIRKGGARIAEAVFFTSSLTRGQRQEVYRYLRDKWIGKELEASVVKASSNTTAVSVPEGRSARVGRVVVAGTSLAKTGAGTLKVGRFQPESPTIDVAGGAVGFDGETALASSDAPAADPILWLDATNTASFVAPEGGTGIAKWKDCRPNKTGYASAQQTDRYPYISSDTCNGLPVVDFGIQGNGDTTSMGLSCGNVIYEAFQVVKVYKQAAENKNQNIFGCDGQQLLRECSKSLIHTGYAYSEPAAGVWTVDGAFVDPWADFTFTPDEFHVASFSTEVPCGHIYLARERSSKYGDQKVGEYIAYNRKLSEKERQQTIAYLMKKWKGVDAPFAKPAAKIARMNFPAENASPRVDADVDTTVGSLVFNGQDSLVKTGAGKLTVEGSADSAVTKYAVEGDLEFEKEIDLMPEMAFHVDASKYETFEFRTEPGLEDSIVKWYDCRGNGLYAKSMTSVNGGNYSSLTNGLYRTVPADDTATTLLPGSPYVDLTKGGMHWYNASNTQQAFSDLREYHAVFCLTASGNHPIIGGDHYEVADGMIPLGNSTSVSWLKCYNHLGAAKKTETEAWRKNNYYQASGNPLSTTKFYVFSVVATNVMRANSFALDRNGSCGTGCIKLCEVMLLRGVTNTTARADMIHNYLLRKWKGVDAGPVPVPALTNVTLAKGASLAIMHDEGSVFSVPTLSGGGTADVGDIIDVANVEAGFDAEGQVSGPTVSGDVTFADTVTVRVSVANPKAVKGLYTVFTADSLANVDDVDFDVQVDNPGRNAYRLKKTPTSLQLEVLPPGNVIIIR